MPGTATAPGPARMSNPDSYQGLSAIGLKGFMETDMSPRKVAIERKSEKHLLWNAFENRPIRVPKPESWVVLRMPDQTAAFGGQIFQSRQPFLYQCLANTLPLILGQHRNRAEAIPLSGTVGEGHGGEGNMADHTAIDFRHQG